MSALDIGFVRDVEKDHFRTNEDTGANLNALMIWNMVRRHVGLPPLNINDLPAACETHNKYHVIQPDYGCVRAKERKEAPLCPRCDDIP